MNFFQQINATYLMDRFFSEKILFYLIRGTVLLVYYLSTTFFFCCIPGLSGVELG